MISLKKLLAEDKKVKIYVQKGKKPPKGKQLKKGPRGGQYFVGSPGEKQAYDKGKSKSPTKKSVNIFDKPKKDKTFNVDGHKIKKSELLQIAGSDFESFTKLSKTRYGLNFVGKLKSGKYDSRDSNLVSGFISDNDVANFVKRKKQTKKQGGKSKDIESKEYDDVLQTRKKFEDEGYVVQNSDYNEITVENKDGWTITFKNNDEGDVDAYVMGYKSDVTLDNIGNKYKDMKETLDMIDLDWMKENDPHGNQW